MAEDVTEKKHRVRGFFRTVFNFNIHEWLAVDEIKTNTAAVVNAYKDIFDRPIGGQRKETFEAAVRRLGLTPEKLKTQSRYFLYFAFFYAFLGVGLFGYSFYLLLGKGFVLAFFVSFIMGALMFSYAFKEHFWYMQISKQKLGCTFREWISFVFRRTQQ